MRNNRSINDVFNTSETHRHMFLRRLTSLSSSIPPCGLLVGSGSSTSSLRLPLPNPAPSPWCSPQGFPPWPPQLSPSLLAVRPIPPSSSGGRWFSTSTGCRMERPHQDREPPYKRRKSAEERRSSKDKEAPRGGAAGGRTTDGGPHMKLRPSESRRDGGPQQKQYLRDGAPPVGPRGPPPRPQTADPQQKPHPWSKDPQLEGGRANRPPPPGTSLPVKSLQRHWETCSTDLHPPGAAFHFSVMSYNILSQDLLQDNAYLYRHCGANVLPWQHRLPNLLDEIRRHDADILCLQEVQQDHYEDRIKPALQELGYQCEYKKRTGKKPDGCAIVFKSSLFSLLSSNPVEFFRSGDALLDRDNVGQVVLLRPTQAPSSFSSSSSSSSVICVANTHLLYNPRRGDIKLAQLAILLAEISRLSRLPDGSTNPVVLCGDFNSTPGSPLYNFLTRGSLDCTGLQIGMVSGQEDSSRGQRLLSPPLWSPGLGISRRCQYEESLRSGAPPGGLTAAEGAICNLTVEEEIAANRMSLEHTLPLRSSYRHRLKPDGRPEVTTCHSRTAMTVDYIMYTPDSPPPGSFSGGRGLQLLSRLSLVGQPELEEVNGLPNQNHPSDHLPLLARFSLPR